MSQSFRPVKEIWGEPSSCFLELQELVAVIHSLAAHAGTSGSTKEYGEFTSIWIEDGKKFLAFLKKPLEQIQGCIYALSSACTIPVEDESVNELASLLNNMKALTRTWYESLDGDSGLTFYIDTIPDCATHSY